MRLYLAAPFFTEAEEAFNVVPAITLEAERLHERRSVGLKELRRNPAAAARR